MTTNGHYKGLERSHIKRKEYFEENGIKIMSQENIDKELVELRVYLSYIRQLLQMKIDENLRQ
jgi:hypothetical protein